MEVGPKDKLTVVDALVEMQEEAEDLLAVTTWPRSVARCIPSGWLRDSVRARCTTLGTRTKRILRRRTHT